MAGLSHKEIKALLRSLEEQGATIERRDKGYLVKYPDGSTDMMHMTDSDWRSTLNFRAGVKRAGLE